MSDNLRAAAQAALKNAKSLFLSCRNFNHLKKDFHDGGKCPPLQKYNEALAALEAALAEPAIKDSLTVAEPVGWLHWLTVDGERFPQLTLMPRTDKDEPLYTAPPAAQQDGIETARQWVRATLGSAHLKEMDEFIKEEA